MPGILPMKVIKVGNSAQSRIAQACDRCRSKKVRCDGVRPTCSQCANVGFECRTSDKLSRRAFPRGYTESLEERVRQLETEVRELKDLLDEKDEKLDILSTMQGNYCRRPSIPPSTSHTLPSPGTSSKASPASPSKEDSFRVEGSPLLFSVENSDSYFMGPSSGRSFIVSFKRRLQELGKPCADFNPDAFLHVQGCAPLTSGGPVSASRPPPRIFSDRCVNVYFQELASLFPVLHKPSFLRIYEEFVSDPEKIKCHHQIAQLYLIFSIAGVSSENPDIQQIAVCERKWSQAIQFLLLENTLSTLQCLILALLYCMLRADNKRVQHFKGLAVGLSHRLGLHQSQKRFSFGVLTLETRKRVFWTLYTLDCFSSATLGLPKLLREEDVQTEYPSDSDDEYVTENGFQPTLPGEYTRLSSALALFRMSRILARILERNYPSAVNYELSLQQLAGFESELDAWYDELPMHLRLTFSQDKPSTDMTGSRSPLLALAFHHVRSLIYRPAVGSSLGDKAAPALLSIADSSKRIIQIVQLLEERNMSFSFCLNKYDLLSLCALTLLYQVVELKQDSKLTRDIERLVNVAIKTLNKAKAPGCIDLARIAGKLIVVEEGQCRRPSPPKDAGKKTVTCRQQQDRVRRMTVSDVGASAELNILLRQPFGGGVETAPLDTRRQGDEISAARVDKGPCGAFSWRGIPSLDYLSLSNTSLHPEPSSSSTVGTCRNKTPVSSTSPSARTTSGGGGGGDDDDDNDDDDDGSAPKMAAVSPAEWETLLGSMDGGLDNVYNAIYGGTSLVHESSVPSQSHSATPRWSADLWSLRRSNSMGDFGRGMGGSTPLSAPGPVDEHLISGDDVAPLVEMGLNLGSADFGKHHVQGGVWI